MKTTIFARPNLKVFLLGAVLVILVHQLITNGLSQSSSPSHPIVVNAREAANVEVAQILSQADRFPASHIYAQLSAYYEGRGDFRKALRYLRLAHLVAETEAEVD